MWLNHRIMGPKDVDGMANSVDPDQTAPPLLIMHLFLAINTLICVTFSLPPGVGCWLRLLLVALPGLFCLPFYTVCPDLSVRTFRIIMVPDLICRFDGYDGYSKLLKHNRENLEESKKYRKTDYYFMQGKCCFSLVVFQHIATMNATWTTVAF